MVDSHELKSTCLLWQHLMQSCHVWHSSHLAGAGHKPASNVLWKAANGSVDVMPLPYLLALCGTACWHVLLPAYLQTQKQGWCSAAKAHSFRQLQAVTSRLCSKHLQGRWMCGKQEASRGWPPRPGSTAAGPSSRSSCSRMATARRSASRHCTDICCCPHVCHGKCIQQSHMRIAFL